MLDLIYGLVALFTLPLWAWRMVRTGKWRTDWVGRLGRGPALPPKDGPTLMIHAVSVGEVSLLRQLVAHLEAAAPNLRLVITTTTDTGHARATALFTPRHAVLRYPFDFSICVRRLLDGVQPTAVALVENEVWPNFIAACEKRHIPVCVINGRLTQRSFSRYRLLAPFVRPMYRALAAAMVQTDAYGDRFAALGVPRDRIHVMDTMKWDTARIADEVEGADALAKAMGIDRNRPLIVAGSTGPDEEKLLIEQWRTLDEEVQLLLVPRKPERFDEVAILAPGIIRRTERPSGGTGVPPVSPTMTAETAVRQNAPRLFLLDTMGELAKAYALADVAIVGRSFDGLGGSDPIEPIALGKPIVIGPDHHNFAEVVEAFLERDAIVVTREPMRAVAELLANPEKAKRLANAGRTVILSRQGATQRHAAELLKLCDGAL